MSAAQRDAARGVARVAVGGPVAEARSWPGAEWVPIVKTEVARRGYA